MRLEPLSLIKAALIGASVTLAGATGASAQLARTPSPLVAPDADAFQSVQYRRYYGDRYGYDGGRYGYRDGWRGRHGYYGRPYYRRRGIAPGAALGAGLAAGALLGGVIASQQYNSGRTVVLDDDAVRYCTQRFRSYDPASGTYLGYDGRRHACP